MVLYVILRLLSLVILICMRVELVLSHSKVIGIDTWYVYFYLYCQYMLHWHVCCVGVGISICDSHV